MAFKQLSMTDAEGMWQKVHFIGHSKRLGTRMIRRRTTSLWPSIIMQPLRSHCLPQRSMNEIGEAIHRIEQSLRSSTRR